MIPTLPIGGWPRQRSLRSILQIRGAMRLPAPGTAPLVLAVVVGPEGGISPEETAALEAAGAMTVRLGPHVMRTASAGPVALAVLAHASGLWE